MKKIVIVLLMVILTGYFSCFFKMPITYRIENYLGYKFKEKILINKTFENNFGAGVYIVNISDVDSVRLVDFANSSNGWIVFGKEDYDPSSISFIKNGFKCRMSDKKMTLFMRDSLTPKFNKIYVKDQVVPFRTTTYGSHLLVFAGHKIYYLEQGFGFQD